MAGKRKKPIPQCMAMVNYQMQLRGITPDEMSTIMRIKPRCFSDRVNSPEMCRAAELINVAKKLKIQFVIDGNGIRAEELYK